MTPESRPVLARRARLRFDRHGGGHVLLAPERGLCLNASASAALALCDGRRTVLEITQAVAPAPEHERALSEVLELFERLRERGLLRSSDP